MALDRERGLEPRSLRASESIPPGRRLVLTRLDLIESAPAWNIL